MKPSIRVLASFEMTGPNVVPGTSCRATSTIRAMIRSTSCTATMTEAAMHRWPAHPDIEATMLVAASSRSASGMTIRWFFAPPSASARFKLEVARR